MTSGNVTTETTNIVSGNHTTVGAWFNMKHGTVRARSYASVQVCVVHTNVM